MLTFFQRAEQRSRQLNVMTEDEPRRDGAHVCSDIGADQDDGSASTWAWWTPVVLPFAGTVSAAVVAIYWSELLAFFSQVFA